MLESHVLEQVLARAHSGDPRILIGPGDDCAHLRVSPPTEAGLSVSACSDMLVGVDQVVDGLHVQADRVSWSLIGRKAVNRSLSDIAAMAGRPLAVLAAVTLPADAQQGQVDDLCDGIASAAEAVSAPLVGGDIAIHRDDRAPLTISVTALGVPTARGPVTRDGACPGDLLVVTGTVGGTHDPHGGGRHLDFRPRLGEAVLLHALLGDALHAMIDISDGLGRDAAHLARGGAAGPLRAVLQADSVPCGDGVTADQAVGEGEDHELLMAIDPSATIPEAIGSPDAPCGVTVVGRFRALEDGDNTGADLESTTGLRDVTKAGWDHGA